MGSGSDFLVLDLSAAPARGRAIWLAEEIAGAVVDGRLSDGDRLPPTRRLAQELGTSRGVVVAAYQRLADQGLVRGMAGGGTVVASPGPAGESTATRPARSGAVRAPTAGPAPLDLSPGVPDLSAFPRTAWLRAEREVLRNATSADLGYGDPQGHLILRSELSRWLARTRGVRVDPAGLVVVSGVAQALTLLARVLTSTGVERVGVEDPGSRGARDHLEYWGMSCVGIAVDDDGLVVDAIPDSLTTVMATPAHQFPTGVVLAPHRRRALLERTIAGGGLIIEDDYDAEHRYDRAPVPALQPAAPDHVAHTGSTSKTLAPGLRTGWLAPPPALLDAVVEARHAVDICGPAIPQLVLARLLASGEYDAHLRRVRARQRRRRDAVVGAVQAHLPEAEVTGVAAGLHVLVLLSRDADDVETAARAGEAGVLVHPLSQHRVHGGPRGRPGLIIGYAAHSPDRLVDAVRRIASVAR